LKCQKNGIKKTNYEKERKNEIKKEIKEKN
jgi:hypothetical protein